MQLRLAPRVLEDFDGIFLSGAESFGVAAADAYLDELQTFLGLLTSQPRIGREYNEVRPAVRLLRFRSHHILYRIVGEELVVLRIVHGSANWLEHL